MGDSTRPPADVADVVDLSLPDLDPVRAECRIADAMLAIGPWDPASGPWRAPRGVYQAVEEGHAALQRELAHQIRAHLEAQGDRVVIAKRQFRFAHEASPEEIGRAKANYLGLLDRKRSFFDLFRGRK